MGPLRLAVAGRPGIALSPFARHASAANRRAQGVPMDSSLSKQQNCTPTSLIANKQGDISQFTNMTSAQTPIANRK
jgi:hypothetical protein